MPEKQNERKLAAILFADIAGYTALMQKDEAAALACLHKFKGGLESDVPGHHGEIIQFYGDGCLAIFNSSVDALECAKQLQTIFQQDPKIPVRIGLHSGDVVFPDGNVFGDAVNIASRVESLGMPGAVLLSSNIRHQIKNKTEFQLASLGRFEFKNVADSMTVYALANDGLIVPKREEMEGKLKVEKKKTIFPKTSLRIAAIVTFMLGYFFISKNIKTPAAAPPDAIAIFPFDVKGSADIQYLGDGMVDLISTKLDEIPDINSIDPNRVLGNPNSQYGQNHIVGQYLCRTRGL